jgi:hypothetical protein
MGRRQRMKQSRKKQQPAPEPVSPELVAKAAELGVPELAQPLTNYKNKVATEPLRVFASEVEQRINTPQRGDIIQIVVKPNEYLARIGIVHEVLSSGQLVCYLPGKKGFPSQFRADAESVVVVGKAKLKFNQDKLPEPSVYSDESARLDNI